MRCHRSILALLFALPAAAATPPAVTFYRHIAPLVYKECAPCHRPGESAPFPLLSYEDVKKHASQIADVTSRRYMPPWLPEPGHGDFAEERRLSDEQLERIRGWVKAGAPAGSQAGAPPPPKFSSDWQLGPPDLILRASKPYQLAADASESFWNFVMPVPITTRRWVRAIEVRPGNPRVFHHANVILDRSQSSRRREVAPGAGFEGMDLIFEEETFDPDGHFLSWKPGAPPVQEPDGMAWRADPGMALVLNVHLKPTGKPETVSPMIGLYFTDKPRSKFPMLVQLERDGALDIPAGEKDFVVSDEWKTSLDLSVLAIYPHAHYLAKVMEGDATLPDGSRKWLIRIPEWDLNWQGVFRLKEPVFLPKGTLIQMRYHFDNSDANPRNPNNPPKRVVGGNRADLEMSHFWLQVLPAAEGDHRAELQESLARQRLAKYPDDFTANYQMGDLLLSQGKAAVAAAHFEKAAAADPRSVFAASELGVALYSLGKLPEAEQQFQRALSIDPAYTDSRFNLASVLASEGKWEESLAGFRQVLAERPGYAKAQERMAQVLVLWGDSIAKLGNDTGAISRYREALPMLPDSLDLHLRLGMAFARQDKLDESQAEFETVLRLKPDLQLAKDALAAIARRRTGR